MNYNKFRGYLRNSVILVKRTMEECSVEFVQSMTDGQMHKFLYKQVEDYLKANGVNADRKSINVLVDNGKELFISQAIKDVFLDELVSEEQLDIACGLREPRPYERPGYYEDIEF